MGLQYLKQFLAKYWVFTERLAFKIQVNLVLCKTLDSCYWRKILYVRITWKRKEQKRNSLFEMDFQYSGCWLQIGLGISLEFSILPFTKSSIDWDRILKKTVRLELFKLIHQFGREIGPGIFLEFSISPFARWRHHALDWDIILKNDKFLKF